MSNDLASSVESIHRQATEAGIKMAEYTFEVRHVEWNRLQIFDAAHQAFAAGLLHLHLSPGMIEASPELVRVMAETYIEAMAGRLAELAELEPDDGAPS
ncbi:hypothetical protein [Mesorhizobium sp. IMUNJ 23232]|uniref:hypothetical protein n=1 Tax=Mesorhizobium sp. IMUNJ 23232 TaxID=3376064 RepID=UPI0037907C2A